METVVFQKVAAAGSELMASIDVTLDRVTWRDFRQPHRPHKELGPFSFDLAQYRTALETARRG